MDKSRYYCSHTNKKEIVALHEQLNTIEKYETIIKKQEACIDDMQSMLTKLRTLVYIKNNITRFF